MRGGGVSDGEVPSFPCARVRPRIARTAVAIRRAESLHRLGDIEAGVTPRLFIRARCRRLMECLSSLQHHPNRPEDVLKVDAGEDGISGDDAADALRYLVATKARTVMQRKVKGL